MQNILKRSFEHGMLFVSSASDHYLTNDICSKLKLEDTCSTNGSTLSLSVKCSMRVVSRLTCCVCQVVLAHADRHLRSQASETFSRKVHSQQQLKSPLLM